MDILQGINTYTKVLDHGSVELVDCMPRLRNAERAIVEAARVSTGNDRTSDKLTNADIKLINRLYMDKHTSPFEMVELKFAIDMPIFVMRQWVRHRTGSFNEFSGRYSQMKDLFYIPKTVRMQHKSNKQMSSDEAASDNVINDFYDYIGMSNFQYGPYKELCDAGVARELARIGLPVNIYTRVYWKVNLHNFLNFMALRLASDAQQEIRVFAEAAYEMVKQICPITCAAFEKYRINTVSFNADEISQLNQMIDSEENDAVMNMVKSKLKSANI